MTTKPVFYNGEKFGVALTREEEEGLTREELLDLLCGYRVVRKDGTRWHESRLHLIEMHSDGWESIEDIDVEAAHAELATLEKQINQIKGQMQEHKRKTSDRRYQLKFDIDVLQTRKERINNKLAALMKKHPSISVNSIEQETTEAE